MPHSPISAGTQVTYQGEPYTVRAVDGNVLELAYHTGGFFRLVHASSVIVCPSPATQTAASLPAPAAGQGVGTPPATERNRAAWMSIADFLARQNLRQVLAQRAAAGAADGKRSAAVAPAAAGCASGAINFGGCVATLTVPDGNHGENLGQSTQQVQA